MLSIALIQYHIPDSFSELTLGASYTADPLLSFSVRDNQLFFPPPEILDCWRIAPYGTTDCQVYYPCLHPCKINVWSVEITVGIMLETDN